MKLNLSKIKNPDNQYRLHMLMHGWNEDFKPQLDRLRRGGVGGVVTNVPWNENYLKDEDAFKFMNNVLDTVESSGMQLWLYDEKGYPSGSADGLTLKDHPEYECRGIVCLKKSGQDKNAQEIELPQDLEKLLYAYAIDEKGQTFILEIKNNKVLFEGTQGAWTLYAFAQKILFEGSHAEKCGRGPRHYPNIMDKEAIAEFIHNTYENYEKHIPNMSKRIDAIFTDEPSMMAGYINTDMVFPYAAYGWQEKLPEIFKQMHNYDLMPNLHNLFEGDSIEARTIRIQFQETVTFMVVDAFFKQINEWCGARGIKFSGHNLLEESIGFHVVMNGNLFACLRNMSWPGVDILTCDPDLYKTGGFHFMMAAKFVGSAARCAGTTERVMVEICPVSGLPKDGYFTVEQLIGTMDLIFFAGINHINSYISADKFAEDINLYTDYFARIAYMLRSADWDSGIAMYYPIEAAQALHTPINKSCGDFSNRLHNIQNTMRQTALELHEKQLDYNIIDAQWLSEAVIEGNCLKAGKLSFKVVIMPCTMAISLDILKKLLDFEKAGGTLLWIGEKPEMGTAQEQHQSVQVLAKDITLCTNAAEAAKNVINDALKATSTEQETLWISKYIKDGEPLYYILNTSVNRNCITLNYDAPAILQVINNLDGSVTRMENKAQITLEPYSSILVCVQSI